jgi:hypothetical protein
MHAKTFKPGTTKQTTASSCKAKYQTNVTVGRYASKQETDVHTWAFISFHSLPAGRML